MKLVPLLDRSGNVKAWADPGPGWIINLEGKVFAFRFLQRDFHPTGHPDRMVDERPYSQSVRLCSFVSTRRGN